MLNNRNRKYLNRLIERRAFLRKRIRECRLNNRSVPSYDAQEVAALEWMLNEIFDLTMAHPTCDKWREYLQRALPIEAIKKSILNRTDAENKNNIRKFNEKQARKLGIVLVDSDAVDGNTNDLIDSD